MMTNGKLLKSSNFERRKIKVDVNFIIENVFKNPFSEVVIFLF